MPATAALTPRWIGAILGWQPTWFLARLALSSAYLLGGVDKAIDFPGAVAEQAHFGLQPAWLWAIVTIVVELGGALLLISGRLVWLAAGALSVLTAVATLVANNFWTMRGHEQFVATNSFFEHLGLIGGLVLAAVVAGRRGRTPEPNDIIVGNQK
jgi:uncharacterized membrane protein YphA (DoxX/SURF4 family)